MADFGGGDSAARQRTNKSGFRRQRWQDGFFSSRSAKADSSSLSAQTRKDVSIVCRKSAGQIGKLAVRSCSNFGDYLKRLSRRRPDDRLCGMTESEAAEARRAIHFGATCPARRHAGDVVGKNPEVPASRAAGSQPVTICRVDFA